MPQWLPLRVMDDPTPSTARFLLFQMSRSLRALCCAATKRIYSKREK